MSEPVDFAWDEGKSDANFHRRGFDFAFAARVFAGPVFKKVDVRRDYGELRIQAIGMVEGIVLFVTYTDRGNVRRIISARRASRRERQIWARFAGL